MPRRKYKRSWERGGKTAVAFSAGISRQYLSDILADRRECSVRLSRILEIAAADCGYLIRKEVWAFPERRKNNPLFPPY